MRDEMDTKERHQNIPEGSHKGSLWRATLVKLFSFFPLSLFYLMSPVFLRADWKRAAQHVEREGSLASNGLCKGH